MSALALAGPVTPSITQLVAFAANVWCAQMGIASFIGPAGPMGPVARGGRAGRVGRFAPPAPVAPAPPAGPPGPCAPGAPAAASFIQQAAVPPEPQPVLPSTGSMLVFANSANHVSPL